MDFGAKPRNRKAGSSSGPTSDHSPTSGEGCLRRRWRLVPPIKGWREAAFRGPAVFDKPAAHLGIAVLIGRMEAEGALQLRVRAVEAALLQCWGEAAAVAFEGDLHQRLQVADGLFQ